MSRSFVIATLVVVLLAAIPSRAVIVDESITYGDANFGAAFKSYFGVDDSVLDVLAPVIQAYPTCAFGQYQTVAGICRNVCPSGTAFTTPDFAAALVDLMNSGFAEQAYADFVTIHCSPCGNVMQTDKSNYNTDFSGDSIAPSTTYGGFCGCPACTSTRSYSGVSPSFEFTGCTACSSGSSSGLIDALAGSGVSSSGANAVSTCDATECADDSGSNGGNNGSNSGDCTEFISSLKSGDCRANSGVYSYTTCACLDWSEMGSEDCYNIPVENWPNAQP